ncbi:Hsp70 family protein [Nocardia callitridis]|uniref:Molecular chaperone n=1 Tax=Nocardia callitridis TaxID=648753 RepID=A0ABP9L2T3_9NOCA
MVLVLGVSAGAGSARAVLTHSDQPHLPPIDQCQVPRRVGGAIDEPVFEAIRRMRGAAAKRDELITATAVTCRCAEHAESIRITAGHRDLLLVDEPLAQLRYLRFTGQLPHTGSVILYDLGSSGLTITHADCRTDTVLAVRRSTVLGGDGYDALLRGQLAREGVIADQPTSRRHREELSSARVITAWDTDTGSRAVLTRNDLAALRSTGLRHSVSIVRELVEESGSTLQAVVLLGGCLRDPTLRTALADRFGVPIVYDSDPDTVSARGAVLLAAQRHPDVRMNRVCGATPPPGSALSELSGSIVAPVVGRRKLVAAVAVTVALAATIAGLLAAQRNSDQPSGRISVPTQIVDTAPTPPR